MQQLFREGKGPQEIYEAQLGTGDQGEIRPFPNRCEQKPKHCFQETHPLPLIHQSLVLLAFPSYFLQRGETA